MSKFNEFIHEHIPAKNKQIKLSEDHPLINSFNIFGILKASNIIVEEDYIPVVFYATREGIRTIIAIMYLHHYIPKYVCISGSLLSMDGEYRPNFIPYDQWETEYQTSGVMEYIEYKYNKKNSPDLSFKVLKPSNLLVPLEDSDPQKLAELEEYIMTNSIGMKFFITTWFITMCDSVDGKLENHQNIQHNYVIISPDDKKLYLTIIPEFSHNIIARLYKSLHIFFMHTDDINRLVPIPLGQKIIPIKLLEFEDFGSIQFNIWKELYCNKLLANMAINGAAGGFSSPCGCFFINIDVDVFDNPSMKYKMEQSNEIYDKMKKIQQVTEDLHLYDTMKRAFEDPIEIARKNIIMSKYALVYISEHVGRTWGDLPNYIDFKYAQHLGEYKYFKKQVFELFYTLHVMNTMGIIHGDLHANNCTINKFCKQKNIKLDIEECKYSSTYIIDNDVYKFEYTELQSCIIDFSRAILNPLQHCIKKPGDLMDKFKSDVLYIIMNLFPKLYEEDKINIEIAILKDPNRVFRLFTILDIYTFTLRMRPVVLEAKLCQKSERLITTILHMSKNALVSFYKTESDELPIPKLLKEIFYKPITSSTPSVELWISPIMPKLTKYDNSFPKLQNDKEFINFSDYNKRPAFLQTLHSLSNSSVLLDKIKTHEIFKRKNITPRDDAIIIDD
jgi:hypothetical protein